MRHLMVLFVVLLASQLLRGCKADGVPNESSAKAEEASM
jgi:outer membrane murein-binding lipoprotein Lpp